MRKIVILDAKTLGKVPNLHEMDKYGEVISYETTSPEEINERVADAEIIITNKVVINKETMDSSPFLKLICISATGTNNVDLDAAKEKGISVKNAVGYSSHSVAQHTFAAILQLFHQLNYYDQYVKSGQYTQSPIFTHFGPAITELNEKTFGIIGLGNIGKTAAKIAEGFGANVVYYSTSGRNTNQEYKQASLDELLSNSDIISIHAPLNEHTQNMISVKQFAQMKSAAIIVNVGRGGIVDEEALAEAIDSHQIAGACIDVFDHEPIMAQNPLLHVKHPEKLVLTPHIAWASIEARTNLIDIVCKNIEEYIGQKA